MRFLPVLTNNTDKALWRLALPMIFSNITVPLLAFVDTAVIGHLNSAIYLGGVAIGAMIASFLFMLLLFLRMSTTGLAAQSFGAKNTIKLTRALTQPMLLALLVGVAIILLRNPICTLALTLVGGDNAVLIQAQHFLTIRLLSAPAALANLVLLGWLLGVQYVRAPVILLVLGNVLNIVLDLWLVIGLGWNVRGAAAATAISEYITLLVGLWLALRVLHHHQISWQIIRHSWRGNWYKLLTLNRDIMLRSLLLQLCFASLTVLGARMGSSIVAVNALLMNFLIFTAYALDGFAYAIEAYSGQAYGASDKQKLHAVWQAACRQAFLVALLFAITYALAGKQIIALLTSQAELQILAIDYLPWQIVLPLIGVWCYLLDGMFIGATKGADMRNSMLFAALGYGLALLLLPKLGNHGLWLALTLFLALRGITLGWIWHQHMAHGTWFSDTISKN